MPNQALLSDFPVAEFVPGLAIYRTKQGDVCQTVKAVGIEPGCKSMGDLEAIEDSFRSAIAVLDSSFRFIQTLFNQTLPEFDWITSHHDPVSNEGVRLRRQALAGRTLYRKDLYYTFVLQSSTARQLAIAYRVDNILRSLLETEYVRIAELQRKVQAVQTQLANSKTPIELLDREQTKRFLNRFVSFKQHNINRAIPHDAALDYWIPNAAPHLYPDHVWHDGHYVKAVCVRALPRIPDENSSPDPRRRIHGSYAAVFSPALDIDCSYIWNVDFRQTPDHPMRSKLNGLHKNWDSKITSATASWFAGKNDTRSDLRQDPEALDKREEIGQAQVSLSHDPWGEYSCSIILHDPDLKKVNAAVPQVFSGFRGAVSIEEDQATYDLWFSGIPGNSRRNTRTMYAPIKAALDTFLLWNDNQGSADNRFFPDGKAFSILETRHRGVHYFAPNEGPVFGIASFGAQGSGKTFVANHVAQNVARQHVKVNGVWHRPKMLILDMKDSYRENTLLHGGTYLQLSMDNPMLKVNPWSLPHTRNNVETIKRLIKILLTGDDNYVTTPDEDTAIAEEVESKYIQKKQGGLSHARLRHVHLPEKLQRRLSPWVNKGQYAEFFDNDVDDLSHLDADWLTIEFTGFGKHSYVLRPILYWHWERFMTLVHDPALALVPKLTLLDEAHEQMIMSNDIAERMLTGINTGRAFNLWNMFVMQWAHLLDKHPFGPAINAACPVKLFTAAENIIPEEYARIFGMPLYVAQQIRTLTGARDVLRYSARDAQILSLNVDPATAAIYANDPTSTGRRHEQTWSAKA